MFAFVSFIAPFTHIDGEEGEEGEDEAASLLHAMEEEEIVAKYIEKDTSIEETPAVASPLAVPSCTNSTTSHLTA